MFKVLYYSVATFKEAARSIDSNSKADYREKLEEELKELRESELWQAGRTVRSLRPENQAAPEQQQQSTPSKDKKVKFTSTLYND